MLREDVIEVPHRLVQVHAEHQADRIHRLTRSRYSSRPEPTEGSLLGANAPRSSRPASRRVASAGSPSSVARAAARTTIARSEPAPSSTNQPPHGANLTPVRRGP